MRILHVINQMWRSGAETSLRQILTTMDAPWLRHEVLSLSHDRNEFDELVRAGISCGRPSTPLRSRARSVAFVHGQIRRRRPDLVHTTLFEADLAGRIAALAAGIPVLTSHVNSQYSDQAAASAHRAGRLQAARAVDGVLARHATRYHHAITAAVADGAADALGIDRNAIAVIPRGRTVARLGGPPDPGRRARVRQEMGLDGSVVILHVGRQDPQKGHVDLIRAFRTVSSQRPDAMLLMAGREGNSTEAIKEAIDAAGLGNRIRALGQRDDVGELLSAADLFAFPSRWEGLGGAVLEAMAMRVPIVASDLPAIREVLPDGDCGRLVPPGDARALATEILRVLNDQRLADDLAARAAARFEERYTLDRCVAAMAAMYMEIATDIRGKR